MTNRFNMLAFQREIDSSHFQNKYQVKKHEKGIFIGKKHIQGLNPHLEDTFYDIFEAGHADFSAENLITNRLNIIQYVGNNVNAQLPSLILGKHENTSFYNVGYVQHEGQKIFVLDNAKAVNRLKMRYVRAADQIVPFIDLSVYLGTVNSVNAVDEKRTDHHEDLYDTLMENDIVPNEEYATLDRISTSIRKLDEHYRSKMSSQ